MKLRRRPTPLKLAPRRYGQVSACDGTVIEVTGLSLPVGSLCAIAHGRRHSHTAEVIGFRNGRTLMSLLGDAVLLRPGALVHTSGGRGCCRWGAAFWGGQWMGWACRSMAVRRLLPAIGGPPAATAPGRWNAPA